MKRLLAGGALGALAMYFLDPQGGRRRRARTRDKVVHAAHVINEAGKVTARDAAHRAAGVWAGTKRLFQRGDISDQALVGRVRAALGRIVAHPHAVEVAAQGGHVYVAGPILAHEVRGLLKCVRGVPGVRAVSDQLTVYESSAGVPALQGGAPRHGERFELLQENWSPAARLATGAVGAALMLSATRARASIAALLAVSGGALLARAVTNLDLRSLVGLGPRGITVQKTITVEAPVETVFAFWTNFQNFPRFMSRVRDIRRITENRSAWTVAGPGGVPVQWIAEVVRAVPHQLIEWRSTAESAVRHNGMVRFENDGVHGTRVNVRLAYVPPAGAFGHAVARLFGADPKSEMDADLMRMKTLIETGHPPHDAARPIRES
jgi:uncharacterized membrane protein